MKHVLICVSLLLVLSGCAALAELGGLEVCVAAGRSIGSAAPADSAPLVASASAAPSGIPRAVATVAPSAAPTIPRVE